jgi:hypothetical protein
VTKYTIITTNDYPQGFRICHGEILRGEMRGSSENLEISGFQENKAPKARTVE